MRSAECCRQRRIFANRLVIWNSRKRIVKEKINDNTCTKKYILQIYQNFGLALGFVIAGLTVYSHPWLDWQYGYIESLDHFQILNPSFMKTLCFELQSLCGYRDTFPVFRGCHCERISWLINTHGSTGEICVISWPDSSFNCGIDVKILRVKICALSSNGRFRRRGKFDRGCVHVLRIFLLLISSALAPNVLTRLIPRNDPF